MANGNAPSTFRKGAILWPAEGDLNSFDQLPQFWRDKINYFVVSVSSTSVLFRLQDETDEEVLKWFDELELYYYFQDSQCSQRNSVR